MARKHGNCVEIREKHGDCIHRGISGGKLKEKGGILTAERELKSFCWEK